MPTLFRVGSFRFFFYSNEGQPREPPHVHIDRDDSEAKLWLRPDVSVAYKDGFNARELNQSVRLVEVNRERIETTWNDFFG
jgi:hypothetical protein